jgi:hypothetical protein
MTSIIDRLRRSCAALLLAWLTALPGVACAAAPEAFNGTWLLDAERSQEFEEAGREFNKRLNEEERSKRKQEFERPQTASNPTRNRFQAQADAAIEMIKEDHRSNAWSVPDNAEPLIGAASIKLYVARKIAVLYDGGIRRLLTINPGGRAFSLRGSEITDDEIGRSLTYFEDEALIIETEFGVGGRLVERYSVAGDGARLVATLRVQEAARGPWLEFVREYVRER